MASNAGDVSALTSQAAHLLAAKMYSLAACVMLFYDISITFAEEVDKIWSQRFTMVTVLWFMNRYLSPLGYIVIIVSFHDPDWSKTVCNRYVLYPEILKIFTAFAIGAIFLLRLYSIYGRNNRLLCFLVLLLAAELATKIWAFTDGQAVNLPPGLVGCILTGRGDSNDRFVYTWVAELIFDTIIFGLTLFRTLTIYRKHRKGCAIPLVKVILRDGIVYFMVIFAANAVTVVLFITLPPDLKAINASFSTLITSLMVSRLILNLRSQSGLLRPTVSYPSNTPILAHDASQGPVTSTLVGNLGDPVVTDWLESDDDLKGEFVQTTYGENLDVTEMNVIDPTQSWSSRMVTNQVAPQVVVEVTRSVQIEDEEDKTVVTPSRDSDSVHSRGGDRFLGVPEDERGPPSSIPLFSRSPPDSPRYTHDNNTHTVTERRSTREDQWFPPESWRVEGVDTHELGKVQKQKVGRRPRTS